ncbi:MAG TPA: glycosyltransferase family 39 protein [Thermoanaerobaculia bacterium]|nr:glycosyltransferase family 39 protein [Thermoanaerobaculia bacterium]
MPMSRRRWEILAAVLIVLLALGLRLHRLADWSLGNDEIAEVRWASGSFPSMIDEVRNDKVHPPLDYIVQHLIGLTAAPEWVRRLPSVIAGTMTVLFVFLLGRWWVSPAAGLFAALMLTLATNHVRYSQEVRPYSMAFFFVAASLVALELFSRKKRWWWAAGWIATVWLAGATLYLAGVMAAVAGFTRIYLDRRETLAVLWRRLPLIVAAWTLLYLPWLHVVFRAARSVSPQPAERLDWPWWQLRLQVFGTGDWRFEPVSLGSWAFWLAVLIGLAVSVRHRPLRTAAAWLLLGSVLTVVFLQLRPHYQTPRYLMPAWIGAFPLAGAAVAVLFRRRLTAPLGVAILALVVGYNAITLRTYFRGERADWRGIAEYVHQRVQPGDTVLLTNNWVVRNFGWYWQRLPPRQGVAVERFILQSHDFHGPAWIVTGQCLPRPPLDAAEVIQQYPMTELAEVRYLAPESVLTMKEELCPE